MNISGYCDIFIDENGELTKVFSGPNIITHIGKRVFSRVLVDSTYPRPDRIAFGRQGLDPDGNPIVFSPTVVSLNDTAPFIKTQYTGSPLVTFAPPEISTRFVAVLGKTEGNLDSPTTYYTEAGLLNSKLELIAVESFYPMIKIPTRRLIYQWTIFQQPSLDP